MDVSDGRASSEAVALAAGKKRKRPVNACVTCRARKVKCDERPNGCLNCERLQLQCVQNGGTIASVERATPSASGPLVGIKRRRTFRSCVGCRESKVKCSGDRPVCTRCRQKMATCVYDADVAEPAWVQSIAPTTAQAARQEALTTHHQPPSLPRNPLASMTSTAAAANCPPSLAWLMDPALPPKNRLHSLLEAYFSNVHPIRVFAFVHKPSFMRMLDEGLLTDTSDQALLHILCALGARFFALDYHNSTSPLPKELIQSAGSQWAKIAEELFFSDYSTISITKLKVLVLLDDHEARTGNYAGSFLLTGLIVRMAHALQLNIEPSSDILFKNEPTSNNEVSWNETRRRLMWACYMVDVWAGSGVDHLTILSEKEIKLQLPCNERQFMLQIPCVTETLQKGEVLDFLSPDDIPEKPWENMGMGAYYVRIVSLWRRVLRFAKNMDDILPPWLPGSEFAQLLEDIQEWKNSLPSWLDFSSDNIYIRRESSQLGGLFLIHCMYHHVLCDLHRIALPELFKAQEPFIFPFDQQMFMSRLQTGCFENAQKMSVLVSTVLQHGIKYFADPILPSFVYNSNRIMLFYIARILDVTKPDAGTVINRTVELVQQNNQALREMSLLYPLAEPLCITTERWLETVRTSLARGHATTYIAPQDPSDASNQVQGIEGPSTRDISNRAGSQQTALSVIPASIANVLNPTNAPDTYRFSTNSSQQTGTSLALYGNGAPTGFEQPMFDLNDLQNFFEWESSAAENTQWTGFEGFNPLGWANNFST